MKEDIALGILVLGESAHFFSAFNPSIFTIKRFPDAQTERDIMLGCLLASVYGFIIALATSIVSKSKLPLIFGVIGILTMDAVYWYAIQQAKKSRPNPINTQ
jgi:hypothetical protein